jgi:ubiquinol-cytochrome c reductase cytochrome c subunit
MRKTLLPFIVAFASCLGAAQAQNAPAGDAKKGEALYMSTGCYACHGTVGQGGAAGSRLTPAMPFQAFLMQLRTPRDTMIPYGEKVMSDAQVADIYAYILSIPKPPDYKTIKLLQ